MTTLQRQFRLRVIIAFALVYVLWGSTYLGIAVAVRHIPPELMTGVRFMIAGPVMLAACALSGKRVAISRGDLLRQGVVGILLLSVSNTVLCWAEQYVRSGLASLIIASVPIWFLVLDTWIFRGERLSARGLVGIALGLLGIFVLLWPKLVHPVAGGGHMELVGSISLLGCAGVWAIGSALSRRWQNGVNAFTATAWQMTIAGAVNFLIALATGDAARADWSWQGLAAIGYLIVFGSWVGYTAYIWLLNNVPTSKVGTYAYVNPVIAVFLGWIALHERVDGYVLAGTGIVIIAVALANSAKLKPPVPAVGQRRELAACEQTGD
ncbi:MAG: EamA family transporter [Acidobacteria bacterium]|nr:EamA family transporter [Acidobacteriaceae bacterium]MBV9609250.1 EamA family transporter [Acidobacteriota bacterium]